MKLPRTPSLRLDGRRALVTGASSGIGFGCAAAVAEAGAHVVCVARREGPLQEAVATLTEAGYSAEALVLDMADLAATAAAIQSQPAFDAVVNAAGMARHGPAFETDPGDYQAVMDLNVPGAYYLRLQCAKAMPAQGVKGSINQD
ncbi:MAG: SDR family NAD(P)-dependent oxidoreductase, partial [Candidatus Competibacterales bacterium]